MPENIISYIPNGIIMTNMNSSSKWNTKNEEVVINSTIPNKIREFLIFTSAGDTNNINQWISTDQLYDIHVVYYGKKNFTLHVDKLYKRKDTKFPNFQWYSKFVDITQYKAIAVWDDDLIVLPQQINSLFKEMILNDVDVFTPCHIISESKFCLKKARHNGIRDVEYVEMNAPIFKPSFLKSFINIFDPILKGWGTDIWFSHICSTNEKCRISVSDTTCVKNPPRHSREINKFQTFDVRAKTFESFALKNSIPSVDPKSTKIRGYDSMKFKTSILPENKTIGWHEYCKLYLRKNNTFSKYADKLNVKEYIKSKLLNISISKTYFSVSKSEDITEELVASLPKNYFMKGSHGYGMTVTVKNNILKCHGHYGYCPMKNCKKSSNILICLRKNCEKWLGINYGNASGESYYTDIPHNCIFEEYISQNDIIQFFVFNEKTMFIQHDVTKSVGLQRTFYTPLWKPLKFTKFKQYSPHIVSRPENLQNIVNIVEQLAKGFTSVRIGLIQYNNKLYFSEYSFAVNNCIGEWHPILIEYYYGYVVTHPYMKHDPEYVLQLL